MRVFHGPRDRNRRAIRPDRLPLDEGRRTKYAPPQKYTVRYKYKGIVRVSETAHGARRVVSRRSTRTVEAVAPCGFLALSLLAPLDTVAIC